MSSTSDLWFHLPLSSPLWILPFPTLSTPPLLSLSLALHLPENCRQSDWARDGPSSARAAYRHPWPFLWSSTLLLYYPALPGRRSSFSHRVWRRSHHLLLSRLHGSSTRDRLSALSRPSEPLPLLLPSPSLKASRSPYPRASSNLFLFILSSRISSLALIMTDTMLSSCHWLD